MLRAALDEMGVDYFEAEGEAAFYGPKLDIQIKTALGKEETLSTIQLDFLLPERFDLKYIGADGEDHRPVMIHRGVISTMERFTAILIENYKGAFPTWLAPHQVTLIPVSNEKHVDYAWEVAKKLRDRGVRADVDERNEKCSSRSVLHKPARFLPINCWRQRNGRRNSQRSSLRPKRNTNCLS